MDNREAELSEAAHSRARLRPKAAVGRSQACAPAVISTGASPRMPSRPRRQDEFVIDVSFHSALNATPAAMLEGAVVALPRAAALGILRRLRSPAWTTLLPGSILAGTFGLLLLPSTATTLVLIAAVTTPALAGATILFVARRQALVAVLAMAAGIASVLATGAIGVAGKSIVTALACLAVGAALSALIPSRWLFRGVGAMAVCDAVLLAWGVGSKQAAVLAAASSAFHGPHFIGARIGATTLGYPDLCLAGLAGARLAGGRDQWWGAALVFGLTIAWDSMLARGVILPETVPIALALAIVQWRKRRRAGRQGSSRTSHPSEYPSIYRGAGI